ncbi:hypothetical protein T11_4619 [Trichinella zimbabwensis]|uniref:Uncharacterized protein n=1 Tax=Trichinella zimbabwensis TaxID=268475 RepID=A0A0V1HC44_9BILA|nr:hypothetical protein T11_4619 [Trichinella zimbabwensis]
MLPAVYDDVYAVVEHALISTLHCTVHATRLHNIRATSGTLLHIASGFNRRSRLILLANSANVVPDVHCQRLYEMQHEEVELVIGNEERRGIGGNVICFVLNRTIFDISVKYSTKLRSLVQYFFLLGNPIFLHFRPILISLIKVVLPRVEMCMKGCFHFSNGNIFDISEKYSMKLRSLVQYFFVLGNPIFLHFQPILFSLIKVVSPWVEMCIKG